MLIIKTLEIISLETIAATFTESFSDYLVPLTLSPEQLAIKIKNDNIDLSLSAGAFESGKLIAFILHGYRQLNGKKLLYNAGTGVIPSKRGDRLTLRLYDFLMPGLQERAIDRVQLEVITENIAAIKTYEAIGFAVARKLNCYKGSLMIDTENTNLEVKPLFVFDWQCLQSFWDFEPTWQHSIVSVENLQDINVSFGAWLNDELVGYIIHNSVSNRVQQFAVNKQYRRRGIGQTLFSHIAKNYGKEISVINIDEQSGGTLRFMERVGLQIYVQQYEMARNVERNDNQIN